MFFIATVIIYLIFREYPRNNDNENENKKI